MAIVQLRPGKLSESEIYRLAGGGDFATETTVTDYVSQAVKKTEFLVHGHAIFQEYPARSVDNGIAIKSSASSIDRIPYPGTTRIFGIQAVVFFVVTIGSALEREVDQCFLQGNPLEGLFLDAAGSVAAEAVTNQLEAAIAADAQKRGWKSSYRVSPGYCNWKMDLQKELFQLVDGGYIGVELSESMLMIPRKSISGAIFLGEELHPINPCEDCKRQDCEDRRK